METNIEKDFVNLSFKECSKELSIKQRQQLFSYNSVNPIKITNVTSWETWYSVVDNLQTDGNYIHLFEGENDFHITVEQRLSNFLSHTGFEAYLSEILPLIRCTQCVVLLHNYIHVFRLQV